MLAVLQVTRWRKHLQHNLQLQRLRQQINAETRLSKTILAMTLNLVHLQQACQYCIECCHDKPDKPKQNSEAFLIATHADPQQRRSQQQTATNTTCSASAPILQRNQRSHTKNRSTCAVIRHHTST